MASQMFFVKRFCAGTIPSALGGLRALKTLYLTRNLLSGESVDDFVFRTRLFILRRSKKSGVSLREATNNDDCFIDRTW